VRDRVVAVMVTYNPDLAKLHTVVQHLMLEVAYAVIVDNGSANIADIKKMLDKHARICEIVELGRNYGIAYALNIAVGRSILQDPTWILTIDQDSIIHTNTIASTIDAYENLNDLVKRDCAIVSLRSNVERIGGGPVNWINAYCARINTLNQYGDFIEKRVVITSGNLIRAAICRHVSFNERLFIDQVDFDFCASLRKRGYRILEYQLGLMDHCLGEEVIILGRRRSYESGERLYYIIRNGTYLASRNRLQIRLYLAQTAMWCGGYVTSNGWLSVGKCIVISLSGFIDGLLARLGQRNAPACP